MRASPKFNMQAALDFGENAWIFAVYPHAYEPYLQEMDNWQDPCPLTDVKCPTYICHGTKDADPITHATQSHEGIAGSELKLIEGGWHYLDFHPEFDNIIEEQIAFVRKHHPDATSP